MNRTESSGTKTNQFRLRNQIRTFCKALVHLFASLKLNMLRSICVFSVHKVFEFFLFFFLTEMSNKNLKQIKKKSKKPVPFAEKCKSRKFQFHFRRKLKMHTQFYLEIFNLYFRFFFPLHSFYAHYGKHMDVAVVELAGFNYFYPDGIAVFFFSDSVFLCRFLCFRCNVILLMYIKQHTKQPEPSTEIIGAPDLYIESGSTINLTCVIEDSPEPPAYIFWNHNNAVSIFMRIAS